MSARRIISLFLYLVRRGLTLILPVLLSCVITYAVVTLEANANGLLPEAPKTSDWATFRGNVARTGSLDGTEAPAAVRLCWSFRDPEYSAPFASSPAVVGDRVYVGCDNDTIYCFDADKGTVVWKFDTDYEVFSSPAVAYDRVYVGEGLHYAEDACFYCLDAGTGRLLWKFQTQGQVESSPTVADRRVYFGGGEDGIYCLDAFSGEEIWRFSGGDVDTAPLALSGEVSRIFFGTGRGDSRIYCLDAETGRELWSVDTPYPAWGPPAYFDKRLYIGVGNGTFVHSAESPAGQMLCLDAETGRILWKYEAQDSVNTAAAVASGKVYFGSRDDFLYCVDAGDGRLIWKFAAAAPVLSSPAISGESVIFGSNDGMLNCLDAVTGEMRWDFDLGGSMFMMDTQEVLSSPAVARGRIYIGSSNMTFYCLEADSSPQSSELVSSLAGEDAVARLMAEEQLVEVGDAAVPLLEPLATSPGFTLPRQYAINVLARIESEEAIRLLLHVLEREQEVNVRGLICRHLGRLGVEEAVPIIGKWLFAIQGKPFEYGSEPQATESWYAWIEHVHALREIGSEDGIPILERMLTTKHGGRAGRSFMTAYQENLKELKQEAAFWNAVRRIPGLEKQMRLLFHFFRRDTLALIRLYRDKVIHLGLQGRWVLEDMKNHPDQELRQAATSVLKEYDRLSR